MCVGGVGVRGCGGEGVCACVGGVGVRVCVHVGVRGCACVWGVRVCVHVCEGWREGRGEGVCMCVGGVRVRVYSTYILVCLLYVHIVCVFIVPRKLEGNHITHVGADDLKPYLALMSL